MSFTTGLVLITALLLQLVLMLFNSLGRLYFDRRQHRAAQERLRLEIRAAGIRFDVKAPTGAFFLDMTKNNPVVLIVGGVGVTPMLSRANAVVAGGSKRERWFFHGVRNTEEHTHKAELECICKPKTDLVLDA